MKVIAIVKENPVSTSPFQYLQANDENFDPLKAGILLGCKTAAILALVYAITIPVLFVLSQPFSSLIEMRNLEVLGREIGNLYVASIVFIVIVYIVGGIPAIIVGFLSGMVIGYIFDSFIIKQLSNLRAIYCGFWISFCLLLIRLFLGWVLRGLPSINRELNEPMLWIVWYIPNIIAFFGFWWVTVKINESLPPPKMME